MVNTAQIHGKVYASIALHLAKYSDAPIVGYLIGNESDNQIEVTDLVPVAHTIPAGPIMEISGVVADKISPTHKVVGFYYAVAQTSNEAIRPVYITHIASNVHHILNENGRADGIILEVKNELLAVQDAVFIEAKSLDGKKNYQLNFNADKQHVITKVNQLLQSPQVHIFNDFEDHMNSGGKADFRNLGLELQL